MELSSELNIKYWGMESLSKIGSLLGIPIETDKYTKEKTMLQSARLLIEVSLEGPYPDYVEFVNDFNVVVRQKVKFEWMQVKCGYCQMLGDKEQEYGKKGTTRMEWRVARPTTNHNDQQQEQDQTDGFIRVQSRVQQGVSEMRSSEVYFSWTNKTLWSRIDRVFINIDWHAKFDFTQVNYLPNGLSDHTPLHIIFLSYPRPKYEFSFCDMWTKDPYYMDLVEAKMKLLQKDSNLGQLKALLNKLKPALRKLNKDKYADLYEQQARAKEDMSHV
ncbi:hypothetical protein Cgig2_007650 [Carnegiea gigantea]|uniref:Endonuclease/exonuclease/phosphatase domain-containing protein n=1 Tax=Carnegiea gigantea TaxID=171969 RepID=A0A9Q1JJS9_9CARY|nr:hypothetical protein Cgig2_007650 [Carnegiea gigantea]